MACSTSGLKSRVRRWSFLAGAALVAAVATHAPAASVTLSSGNSVATIDEATGNVTSLTVNGKNQLGLQSIYYSANGGSPRALSTLEPGPVSYDPQDAIIFLNYNGPNFQFQLSYTLTSGSSAASAPQLSTDVLVLGNSLSSGEPFSAYQYDHPTPGGSTNNVTQVIAANKEIVDAAAKGNASATVTPLGSEYQVGIVPAISNMFTSLSEPVTLSDAAGPVTGNGEFALETDDANLSLITPLTALTVDTFNSGVPLPPAFWMGLTTLAGIGMVGLLRRRPAQA